jgi:hypothetical protein
VATAPSSAAISPPSVGPFTADDLHAILQRLTHKCSALLGLLLDPAVKGVAHALHEAVLNRPEVRVLRTILDRGTPEGAAVATALIGENGAETILENLHRRQACLCA